MDVVDLVLILYLLSFVRFYYKVSKEKVNFTLKSEITSLSYELLCYIFKFGKLSKDVYSTLKVIKTRF